MTNKLNYSDKSWRIELPKSEPEWRILVTILNKFGIAVHDPKWRADWTYIALSRRQDVCGNSMERGAWGALRTVSLFEAIVIMTTPAKSATELKIEQLERTIAEASAQIQDLKVSLA
tara:strand:- start:475 stop:825 length:351 start_codon:yes stop_codon:yes gene_type:complete